MKDALFRVVRCTYVRTVQYASSLYKLAFLLLFVLLLLLFQSNSILFIYNNNNKKTKKERRVVLLELNEAPSIGVSIRVPTVVLPFC